MYFSACAALLAVLLPSSLSHPQCLDFQPPFQESDLSYCTEYRDFGCCVTGDETGIRERADGALAAPPEPQRQLCGDYLKNISCLVCSPYAAHIFETEGGGQPRDFPELCGTYCVEAYRNCRAPLLALLGLRPWEEGLVAQQPQNEEELRRDAEAFCGFYVPEDSPYCYPEVLDGPDIDGFSTEQVGELGCLCGQSVLSGVRNPVAAVHAGDGSGRLFIVEQIGVIHVLDRERNLLPEPFLDMDVLTTSRKGDERGLLGLAFHPNHAQNGLFYIYYSTRINFNHFSIVSEFHVNASDINRWDENSERVLLSVSQPYSNHNGGQLLFQDGYLLVFLGDGGSGGDPFGHGINLATLLGSVLRIDVNGREDGNEYSTPPDNPFVNDSNARPEIYAYGLRNPWRCSVDRGDPNSGYGRGRLFCGDVGQDSFEEVDIIEKGKNYGWKGFEGDSCFSSSICDSLPEAVSPIDSYPHSVGVSVTGGYVYRGCVFPNLQGLYIFGDYGSGRLLALREKGEGEGGEVEWEREELCMGDSSVCTDGLVGVERKKNILSFGEDEEGELYLLATSNASPTVREGVVYRIIDPARRAAPTKCQARDVTGTSAVVPAVSNTATPIVTAESSANTLASVFIPVIILTLIRTF